MPTPDAALLDVLERFDRGAGPVDVPVEDFEVGFDGRDGLNRLGRQQFGLKPMTSSDGLAGVVDFHLGVARPVVFRR